MTEIERLVDIMRTLRSPQGCPWDREQNLITLRPYAVEEVYEVLDAIDRGDVDDHCEELGDLLLQVVFQAQIRAEEGAFDFEAVARVISEKLIRRHPHVFGEVEVADSAEVLRNWNEIKQQEKADRPTPASALTGVPQSLPALLLAEEVQKKAAKVGFDWPDLPPVLDKMSEELAELREAISRGGQAEIEEELGDFLFAAANLGRHLRISTEQALRDAVGKFSRRFQQIEALAQADGQSLRDLSLAEMDALWDQVKSKEA